jgi:protein ImuB
VDITVRDELTARPAQVAIEGAAPRRIVAWAGPWPTDERWWSAPCRRTRIQVLLEDPEDLEAPEQSDMDAQTALLLVLADEKWTVEGMYD